MGLTSVAGVFSRYFIVGFFMPAFFTFVGLAQVVSHAFMPSVYENASPGARIAILGGAALLSGLLLLGLSHPILRLYEGYPLQAYGKRFPLKRAHAFLTKRQCARFKRMKDRYSDTSRSETERYDLAWKLDRRFPHDNPKLILPTAFGNAVRAFERHSFVRWHLNGVAAWPYMESMLSAQEAQLLSDVRSDVSFFLNASLLALVSGVLLILDRLLHDSPLSALVGLVAFALSWTMYVCATGAAVRWGEVVRAATDLHRLELYTRLGVRTPRSFSNERFIAWCLNDALMIGKHLPDALADFASSTTHADGDPEVAPPPTSQSGEEARNDA